VVPTPDAYGYNSSVVIPF